MNDPHELRREFDDAFSRAVKSTPVDVEQYLIIRMRERRLAIRVGDVTSVRPGTRLTSLPGSEAGCLGLALVDGRIVRVQSLGCDEPKWFVLRGSVALAVDELCEVMVAPRDVEWVATARGRVERVDPRALFEGESA